MKKLFLCLMSLIFMSTVMAQPRRSGPITRSPSVLGTDLEIGTHSIDGDSSAGLAFDPDNDGTNEITFGIDGAIKAPIFTNTPEVDQNITAVGDTLSSSATHVQLNPNADYVMTSTPTIAAGVEGQLLIFENISAFDIDMQDDSVLAGSDIFLGRAEGTIAGGGVAYLFYTDSNGGGWCVLSNPNTAALGADATLMEARNETGVTIAAGKPVYIVGYNVGQGRPLIALADSDDSSKMPAIGIVATAITTGKNGDVITSGSAINIIDTSGKTINDPVYVGTTAGELVYARPTGATTAIQRIGTVARVNVNNGVVIITGAGRQNDQENVTEAYIFVGNASEKPVAVAMSGDATIIADGTVTVAAMVSITLDTDPTITLAAVDCKGGVRVNYDNDVIDYTLPNADTGLSVMIQSMFAAVVTIDCFDANESIVLDDTTLTAGNAIDSPGTKGDYILLVAISATEWVVMGRSGAWVDGDAD